MIARVTLELALRKEFDYLIPPEFAGQVEVGSRVKVPFGPRQVMGCGTALVEESPHTNLRPILKVVGQQSLVTPKVLALARWIADYYSCPVETALKSVLPEAVRREKEGWQERLFVRALAQNFPDLDAALERLVSPTSRGDPMNPLRWTIKSTRKLAAELKRQGYELSHPVVAERLAALHYSLQANAKAIEQGSRHPDRNAQFEHINRLAGQYLAQGQPVISVDTKRKELVGPYKNGGREWQPAGQPGRVQVHDFIDESLGKAIPYGVYDLSQNLGWVNVGRDHDTAAFAVESIRRWWRAMGQAAYPAAQRLLICADGGDSNGYRVRLWKKELQQLSDELGLAIAVCHYPPGTSKWNKIEHRLFAFISQNWRAKPLTSHQVVIELIASTTTRTGLKVQAAADTNAYPDKVKVSDAEMASLNLKRDRFHGEWNYTLSPRTRLEM